MAPKINKLSTTDQIEEAFLNLMEDDMDPQAIEIERELQRLDKHIDTHLDFLTAHRGDFSFRKAVNVATVQMFEYIRDETVRNKISKQPPVERCRQHITGWMLGDKTAVITPEVFLRTMMHNGCITMPITAELVDVNGRDMSLIVSRSLVRRYARLQCLCATFVFQAVKTIVRARDDDGDSVTMANLHKHPCMFVNGYFEIANVPYEVEGAAVRIE